ncbi:MAG TPA: hypothetical protein VNK43_03770, partial [Gemmatimonadales bacterium]|nr:hypothetical protein [Gemmatimonadales bacterium]
AVLAIEPATIYLLPSENVRATARALREDGSPVGAVRVVWKSLRPDVATVDAEGVIVGLVPGHGIVQASIPGGLTATVPVEVSQAEFRPTVERLVLSPGDLDTLEVVIPSQGGRPLRNGLQWRSTDPAVVRVGPTGIVQAMGPGQAEVVVSGFFQERRIAIQVHRPIETLVVSPRPSAGPLRVPLQGTRTVAARAEAADSTVVPEAPFRWEVGDTSVVAFDPATGTLTGRALGTTSLSLRLKGFALTNWVVEVIPGGIALSRGRLALAPGERAALTPILLDDKGNALGPVAEARWSSSDPQVARVGADGTVEAAGIGHATVTAGTPWGKSAAAEVYVVGDLLLTSNRRGVGFGIHQLRAAAPEEALPVLADSAINLDPVWSPDRTRIAFSSNRSGDFELYLMDADGRNLRRLTEARGVDDDPSWTPDGRQLVFTSERTGTKQIHLLTLETGEIRALTASPGGNQAPVVSPDGRSIAFVSARDGNHEVYLMDLDGGNQRNLTRTAARESAPRFFPNGDLLYAVDRPGKGAGAALMRLTPATGAATTLGTTDHPVTALAVSRDGETLAYVLGRLVDASRGQTRYSLHLRGAAPGAVPAEVKLQAGEQVATPSF